MIYDMGHKLTEAELVAATLQLDKNGDGKISYDEFTVPIKLSYLHLDCHGMLIELVE